MNSFPSHEDAKAVGIRFDGSLLIADLADGRWIGTPIAWYPRLRQATKAQRNNWEIIDSGFGIHWPDLDEDLSIAGMLRGTPAPNWQQPD